MTRFNGVGISININLLPFTYSCVIIANISLYLKILIFYFFIFPPFSSTGTFFNSQYMSGLWVNKNSPYKNKLTDFEKPVLDENRNRIVTYDKIFHKKPESGIFSYLRDRGY